MPTTAELLDELLKSSIIAKEDWDSVPPVGRERLASYRDPRRLLEHLERLHLITDYQSARIQAGNADGLVLGNYRVLERLGAGSMGVVFKAEHIQDRQLVAIKVLVPLPGEDHRHLLRFFTERQATARLQHPNIIDIQDVGEATSTDPVTPVLHYYVMEYVRGRDLEEMVRAEGALKPERACDLISQIAQALAEVHRQNLVHRDVKPGNILVTPTGQAKLFDFGLVRQGRSKVTEQGKSLGTLEFIAPEQIRDARSVDGRADIYALGASLYWCLTGQAPFDTTADLVAAAEARFTQAPPSARSIREEIEPELDAVVARMMAPSPEQRFPSAEAVLDALEPFHRGVEGGDAGNRPEQKAPAKDLRHILIVDDEPDVRSFCMAALGSETQCCEPMEDGKKAMAAAQRQSYDLVLLDADLPGNGSLEVLAALRNDTPSPHVKVIMLCPEQGKVSINGLLAAGADDYLNKPLDVVQLRGRVKTALQLKSIQDQTDSLLSYVKTHGPDDAAQNQETPEPAATTPPSAVTAPVTANNSRGMLSRLLGLGR